MPLLGKVRAELERMEQLGVIAKVDTPTDWCVGMVVVPKPNGTIRICVDLTKLNQSVCSPSAETTRWDYEASFLQFSVAHGY